MTKLGIFFIKEAFMRYNISSSFFRGYRKSLDLGGTKNYPDVSGGITKDFEALRSDWYHVGESLQGGVSQIRRDTDKYVKRL